MRIFKYDLKIKEEQTLQLPLDAQIIRVEDVDGEFFLWALVDEEEVLLENRYLEYYKTGQPFKSPIKDLKYLGFAKLFIMQELGLYIFENIKKRGL